MKYKIQPNPNPPPKPKNPKCKGHFEYSIEGGWEFDCGYGSYLECEDCKYGHGRKDPEKHIN